MLIYIETNEFTRPFVPGTQNTLKYVSLVTLTVQNAALNLAMRSSRTQRELFIASTAVVMAECIKLITCIGIIRFEEGSWSRTISSTHRTVFVNFWDTLKVG